MKKYEYIMPALALIMIGLLSPASRAAATASDSGIRVSQAIIQVKSDVEKDTKALNSLRVKIAKQRRPLTDRLTSLRKSVREDRAEVERIRRLRQQGEKEQAALIAEADAVEAECRFLQTLFSEYARAMETRVDTAQAIRLSKRLRPVQVKLTEDDRIEGFAETVGQLFDLAAGSNAERMGGMLFDGVALDQNGVERPGHFAALGPIAYFADADEEIAGPAITQFGASQPAVYDRFSGSLRTAIRQLVNGYPARVPVDVTGGDAIKVKDAKPTFFGHLKKGGFVMVPLLLVAIAALVLALWKGIELGRIRLHPGDTLEEIIDALKKGDIPFATERAGRLKQPLRSLVEEAIVHRDSPRGQLEEIMHEHVLSSLPMLERNLGTLAVLGGISPLLGLLGTVTGMIHTFQLVTIFGSGDAKLLSGGISEALVTTETGLAIAIPVLLVHAFLARRVNAIIGALERTAVAIVNDLKIRSNGE